MKLLLPDEYPNRAQLLQKHYQNSIARPETEGLRSDCLTDDAIVRMREFNPPVIKA